MKLIIDSDEFDSFYNNDYDDRYDRHGIIKVDFMIILIMVLLNGSIETPIIVFISIMIH